MGRAPRTPMVRCVRDSRSDASPQMTSARYSMDTMAVELHETIQDEQQKNITALRSKVAPLPLARGHHMPREHASAAAQHI
jgi:hypothetical protein